MCRPAKRRKRESRYPTQYTVCVSVAVAEQLEALADSPETAMGTGIRPGIERGIPPPEGGPVLLVLLAAATLALACLAATSIISSSRMEHSMRGGRGAPRLRAGRIS